MSSNIMEGEEVLRMEMNIRYCKCQLLVHKNEQRKEEWPSVNL
ncbi:hypothetical protein ACFL20_09000 [Spirochaetota bacterium]